MDGMSTQVPVPPVYFTVQQVADALQVNRKTVREMVARGELPCVRVGRSLRIPRSALDNLPVLAPCDGKGPSHTK